jgi:hypothetical protein
MFELGLVLFVMQNALQGPATPKTFHEGLNIVQYAKEDAISVMASCVVSRAIESGILGKHI